MSLYLALGVPEVWCYDGARLQFYALQEQSYQIVDRSSTFSFLSPIAFIRSEYNRVRMARHFQV